MHPGKRLSLQSHKFHEEHWFIISGKGIAELNGLEILLGLGDSIDIPIRARYRIACISDIALVFVEVQTGSFFGEEDIVRFDDDFVRVPAL